MLDDYPKARKQLETELVAWLTTVGPDGQPQSSAVWFLLRDDEALVFSRAKATRLRNLAHNPKVAFNLRGDPQGDFIVTIEGVARVDSATPLPHEIPEYLEKYGTEITRLGWTPESFSDDFPVPIWITFDRIRAWPK